MGDVRVLHGDSREVLKTLPDNSVDSVVTDPPYALVSIVKRFGGKNAAPAKGNAAFTRASAGFMGQQWDTGETVESAEFWAEVYRVLKPGGHVLAFSGTRTQHRQTCAIEDAGFEIRDMMAWLYGSGFPKSHDVSKGIRRLIDRESESYDLADLNEMDAKHPGWNETDQEWQGWGTALKPALEPICVARKPLAGTVAANVLEYGTGALNIEGARVGDDVRQAAFTSLAPCSGNRLGADGTTEARRGTQGDPKEYVGRWPANVLHDGSDEVVSAFPESEGGGSISNRASPKSGGVYGEFKGEEERWSGFADSGSAARFFYTAKADSIERLGSKHPTVKPIDLMAYLVRLVTPPGGTVLDPFAGSGTTGVAAVFEGFNAILIEREAAYVADIERRIAWARGQGGLTKSEIKQPPAERMGGLFEGLE